MKKYRTKIEYLYLLPILFLFIFYNETWVGLLKLWTDSENSGYSHGLLLAPIAIWIFYVEYNKLRINNQVVNKWIWILFLLFCSIIWFFAELVQVTIVKQITVIVSIGLIFLAQYGYAQGKRLLIPVILLLSAIPVWSFIGPTLQYITAITSGNLLKFIDIPVYRDNYFIHIPSGIFEVEIGCSGLRYQAVGFSLVVIYSYINSIRLKTTLVYCLVVAISAFIANILRIVTVIYIGHLTEMKSDLVEDHAWIGWSYFGVLMFVLIVLEKIISSRRKENVLDNTKSNLRGILAFTPVHLSNDKTTVVYLFILIISILVGPVLAAGLPQSRHEIFTVIQYPSLKNWSLVEVEDSDTGNYKNADYTVKLNYKNNLNGDLVTAEIYLFYDQASDKEAIDPSNILFDKNSWILVGGGALELTDAAYKITQLTESLLINNNDEKKLVWNWYVMDKFRSSNNYLAKIYNAINIIEGDARVAIISVSTKVIEDREDGRATMRQFLHEVMPRLELLFFGSD